MDQMNEQLYKAFSTMDVYDFVVSNGTDSVFESYGGMGDTHYPRVFPLLTSPDEASRNGDLIIAMLTMKNSKYRKTIGLDYRLLNTSVISALIVLYREKIINGIRL